MPRSLPAVALALAATCALVSGCDGTGEPKSAGRTAGASAPALLWPGRTPAPEQTYEPNSAERPTPLKSAPRVPSDDLHRVSALAVAQAKVASMTGELDEDGTNRKIGECRAAGQKGCPVLAPQYRDLNGDGKDELLLGIESGKTFLFLWGFTAKDGVVTQIMDAGVTPLSVELSGHDVIIREPAGRGGYSLRRVYSWDDHLQAMNERVIEYDATRTTR
ncbi:hypothetical protein ACFYWU_19310 [Streptomyces chrestomyceticus]|uniref:hypothetical protein n=1 Tax=Streptomyces chrestomyceticus TaxID=68185 RepID=UPI0019D0CE67|nr:hypothetical protein [Streptomyces chrestomyceticus]